MALNIKQMVASVKGVLGMKAAGFDSDPNFFGKLHTMPNPDPILRAMGMADRVYASILSDPHVMGDVRSIRGEFADMDYRIVTWAEEDTRAKAARDLCERWMQNHSPNPAADWEEIMWQMMSAIFKGYAPHELVWGYWEGNIVPVEVLDRPNRRFSFDYDANPLLISKGSPEGVPVEPYRFVVSRHMASTTNPYGQALLSSCFWPWTFKTGGWKYFVKYCERHGLPWPVARYGQGAGDKDLADLGEAIESMIDSGYALVPDGTGVELLVPTSSGSNLPQESLINLSNREMSKALTGQAMVSELQNTGSRAASETAERRQSMINNSDRSIAATSFSKIFRHITTFNFGPDVPSPELEFFKTKTAGKERADTYKVAADMGARPSRRAMLEELNIPVAADDADALLPVSTASTPPDTSTDFTGKNSGHEFTAPDEEEAIIAATMAADDAIEANVIEPIARMLAQAEKDGKSLADVRADLVALVGEMDITELRELTDKALVWSFTQGYNDDDR